MKKLLTLLLALTIIMSTLLTGCAGGAKTIKIGMLTPKSGDLAQYGIAVENAAILAVKKVNDAGGIDGKKVELIVYDNEADATKSVNLFNRLVDNDKVVALVGPVISTTSLAVAEVANEKKIPMISPTATNKDVTPDYEYVFRACYIDPYQGSVMAKFATDNLKATKAVVLKNVGSDYSTGLATAFEEKFTSAGGSILASEGYTSNDKDFKAILTKIKDMAPEVIFIPDYYGTVGIIASQIKEVGIDAVLLGGDGWDEVQNEFGDVMTGSFFANHYSTTDTSPIIQGFITDYSAAYNGTPNALAALSYDATTVMMNAIKAAGSTDSEKVLAALKATDSDAVTGHIIFNEFGDPQKEISIIKINGKELSLETKLSE